MAVHIGSPLDRRVVIICSDTLPLLDLCVEFAAGISGWASSHRCAGSVRRFVTFLSDDCAFGSLTRVLLIVARAPVLRPDFSP